MSKKKNKSKNNDDVQSIPSREQKIDAIKQALQGMGAVQINLFDVMKQKESGASVGDAIRAAMNRALLQSDDPILKALAERVIGQQVTPPSPVLTPDAVANPDAFAQVMQNALGKSEQERQLEEKLEPIITQARELSSSLNMPFMAIVQTDTGLAVYGNTHSDDPRLVDTMRAFHKLNDVLKAATNDKCPCPVCTARRESEAEELRAAEARERAPESPKTEESEG